MKIAEAINEFLIAGQQAGWSAGTGRAYGWHLERLRRWAEARGLVDVASLSRAMLRSWGAGLREQWEPATVKGAVTAARAFLRWLRDEGVLDVDLASALKVPTVPGRIQRTISAGEVAALLTACETPVQRGLTESDALVSALRNAAIVALLYDSLLRASELCALNVGDVDLAAGRVIVRRGKGGRGRLALFSPETAEALRAWLAMRKAGPAVSALFVSVGGNTPGESLTTRGLRIILKRLGERAGIEDVSPHAFRRGGSVALTLAGAPTRLVQEFGGWSSVRMVEIYTRALSENPDALAAFQQYSPVAAVRNGNGRHRGGMVELKP